MSTAAPNTQGGYTLTPIALFVLSTAMASATATAVAFMLTSSAQSEEPTECTCACEAPQPAPVVETTPAPDLVPPAPEPQPKVVQADPPKAETPDTPVKVKGSLDKPIIRRIVRAHLEEVRYCYNQGLSEDPALGGRVDVQFTISPKGEVPVAVVASSTLDHDATETCIAKAVKRWKFPKPKGEGNVVVTYPFVLQPS